MPLKYDIKTMGDIENDPILISIGAVTGDFALKVVEELKNCHAYKCLEKIIEGEKLPSYFHRIVAIEIYAYIVQLMINRRKGKKEGIWLPKSGIYKLLKQTWPVDEMPIMDDKKQDFNWQIKKCKERLGSSLKSILKAARYKYGGKRITNKGQEKAVIALHYVEGIDLSRRSDLSWLNSSGIRPGQVLIYFDGLDNYTGKKHEEVVIKAIESQGMSWVALKPGIIDQEESRVWAPLKTKDRYHAKFKVEAKDSIDKWVIEKGQKLLSQVDYWLDFYSEFNIKLLVLPEQSEAASIIQGIAFDLLGKDGGFTVGKQRSDMWAHIKGYVGHHTKDIQFVWNQNIRKFLQPPYNQVRSQVIAGNIYDVSFNENAVEKAANKKKLLDNGARFIVALFDQGHGGDTYFSSSDLEAFYREFLTWVLADKTMGVVIKSKKPYILKSLPEILPILRQAEATGRCINLTDEFGRLPTDASKIADLAVGFTMNSAVTEAVIAGCRGIHYLKEFPKSFDYFKWGNGRLVFNDLSQMIAAIKRYKINPASQPELGNWQKYLDQLDPFCDGLAGKRMGEYLRFCLEGFETGCDRTMVLKQANKQYCAKLGKDKVITFGEELNK